MPENEDQKEDKQEHGGRHGCMTIIVIVMLLVGMLFAAIPLFANYYIRRGMDPTELARLEDFKTRPVTIPPSWRTAKPHSPEFRQKIEDWSSAWRAGKSSVLEIDKNKFAERLTKGEMTSEEWTSIAAVLSAAGPLMDAATESDVHVVLLPSRFMLDSRASSYSTQGFQ